MQQSRSRPVSRGLGSSNLASMNETRHEKYIFVVTWESSEFKGTLIDGVELSDDEESRAMDTTLIEIVDYITGEVGANPLTTKCHVEIPSNSDSETFQTSSFGKASDYTGITIESYLQELADREQWDSRIPLTAYVSHGAKFACEGDPIKHKLFVTSTWSECYAMVKLPSMAGFIKASEDPLGTVPTSKCDSSCPALAETFFALHPPGGPMENWKDGVKTKVGDLFEELIERGSNCYAKN